MPGLPLSSSHNVFCPTDRANAFQRIVAIAARVPLRCLASTANPLSNKPRLCVGGSIPSQPCRNPSEHIAHSDHGTVCLNWRSLLMFWKSPENKSRWIACAVVSCANYYFHVHLAYRRRHSKTSHSLVNLFRGLKSVLLFLVLFLFGFVF